MTIHPTVHPYRQVPGTYRRNRQADLSLTRAVLSWPVITPGLAARPGWLPRVIGTITPPARERQAETSYIPGPDSVIFPDPDPSIPAGRSDQTRSDQIRRDHNRHTHLARLTCELYVVSACQQQRLFHGIV